MSRAVYVVTIDGHESGVPAGETILAAAKAAQIEIPTLCATDGLSLYGGCRLCLVEVTGRDTPVAACVTPVEEGMVVQTRSKRVDEYRRQIVELLFSERNHVCSVCVQNGHCELQSVARSLGVVHHRYHDLNPHLDLDASHDRFISDPNRCILCSRCVRICSEIEGSQTRDIAGRGLESRLITGMAEPWREAESCTGCGKCVYICPTASLTERTARPSDYSKKRNFLPGLVTMRGGGAI